MCRYCLDSGNELVSPCKCTGGQKFVHLACLQKWQHSTLLSQSTHPRYQTNIDTVCNVCLSEFTIKPPTRHEKFLGYTGEDLANMLDVGYLIISGKESSEHNEFLMEKYKENTRLINNIKHWTRGVYLITDIIKRNGVNDGILAVNLTKPLDKIPNTIVNIDDNVLNFRNIWNYYYNYITKLPYVKLKYYMGGPCNPEECRGICIVKNIKKYDIQFKTLSIIPSTASEDVIVGPLNSVVKLAEFLYKHDSSITTIYTFIGFAGWSRTQLLGEISRGGWGMCRFNINDFKSDWNKVYEKGPMFAQKTEYSDNYNHDT